MDKQMADLFEIQGTSDDIVTRAELLEELRQRGAAVTARELTRYVAEGLVPRSLRFGSRDGVYPRITIDLVYALVRGREAGLSLEVLQELLPVWMHLRRARRDRCLVLPDFEQVAREHVRTLPAAYAVPWMLGFVLPSPLAEPDEAREMTFVLKSGDTRRYERNLGIDIEFVVADHDPKTGDVRPRSVLRVSSSFEPSSGTVVLGLPNDIEFPRRKTSTTGRALVSDRRQAPQTTPGRRPRSRLSRSAELIRDRPAKGPAGDHPPRSTPRPTSADRP